MSFLTNVFRLRSHMFLSKAASLQDIGMTEVLLSAGADVNGGDGQVLHAATQTGNVELVALLLNNGAKINTVLKGGSTVLNETASKDHTDVVKLLVGRGADPRAGSCGESVTALYHAVGQKDYIMAQCLLDAGAARFRSSESLLLALYAGDVEMVKMLVKGGANVWDTDTSIEAIRIGNLPMVAVLLNAPVNVALWDGDAVFFAASKGYTAIVKQLLEMAPKEEEDQELFRAFMAGVDRGLGVAATNGHYEIVKLLLEAGGSRYETVFTAVQELGK
ncbi:hypothetical protein HDV00_001516 [Rhizophlyctis rosea]|nr:hypothetical protein HDV00_001516 [Rhizophlyctis rosea]